ncbi:MAG TPA: hypothetical protein VIF11_15750 [Methylomirabilota bacterium]
MKLRELREFLERGQRAQAAVDQVIASNVVLSPPASGPGPPHTRTPKEDPGSAPAFSMSGFRIKTITAFVAVGADGDEGIIARKDSRGGTWMPLIGADGDRIESLAPHVQAIADETGQEIRMVRFSVREDLATILPRNRS